MKRERTNGKASAAKARSSPAHRFFIYKVGILRRLLDRYSTPALTDQFDLTVAEWRVLTHLYIIAGDRVAALSARSCR